MPIQLNFTDAAGVAHPEMFITITQLNVDWIHRHAMISLGAYHNAQTYLQGREPVISRTVFFSSEPNELGRTFDNFFAMEIQGAALYNQVRALETQISQLARFAGSQIVEFPV